MVQEQYWKEIYQLKVHINFIELKLEEAERRDRYLKITIAIASSTSIGAWAIWNTLSWIWCSIIALSQVISAVSPFLPYKSRMKSYASLLHELEELMVQSEFKWFEISQGYLSSEEINKARFEIRKIKQKSLNKHIQTTIPTDTTMQLKAEQSATQYFENFYPS